MATMRGMRSDIRNFNRIEIKPQTTRISLSDRFRMLQTQPALPPPAHRIVSPPVRGFQMALQMAGQTADMPQRRVPVRQRLGPRPGIRVRNKHLFGRQAGRLGVQKRLAWAQPFRRVPIHARLSFQPARNKFRQQLPVHTLPRNTSRPRLVRNNFHLQGGRNPSAPTNNRFRYRNPNLVLNQTGGSQFYRSQPKASKEQLDNDLDSYMAQSRGYLNPNLDQFLQ